jgi:hypothetical protein
VLRDNVDAYGHPWENFGLILYTDPEFIAEETCQLKRMFREEHRFQQDEAFRSQPGFIQDFTGVDNYVRIGGGNTGEPYCIDFGADSEEPSVVSWPTIDGYWRRVAPNFETFIALFSDESEAPPQAEDEEYEVVQPTPRSLLAAWVPQYVVATQAQSRPGFFVQLASMYAELGPEERQEVGAQVREELERWGMTDEQWRTLDELWVRLRTRDEALLALLGDTREAPPRPEASQPLQSGDVSWKAAPATPRIFLADWVKHIVVASREEARPLLEQLASAYAELSPNQRLEIEAEVKEAQERWKMTDEQRQKLDELWEQLRATRPS